MRQIHRETLGLVNMFFMKLTKINIRHGEEIIYSLHIMILSQTGYSQPKTHIRLTDSVILLSYHHFIFVRLVSLTKFNLANITK